MKWHLDLYFTWGASSIHRIRLAKMSIIPKRIQFCWKMLCFQQLTQLNLVIAVENTLTRANSFNLSDPAVVGNERAVTSRHRHEEDTKNPRLVAASTKKTNLQIGRTWIFPSYSYLLVYNAWIFHIFWGLATECSICTIQYTINYCPDKQHIWRCTVSVHSLHFL